MESKAHLTQETHSVISELDRSSPTVGLVESCVFNKQVYLAAAFVRRSGVNRAEHVHARQNVLQLIEQPEVVHAVIDRGYSQDLC